VVESGRQVFCLVPGGGGMEEAFLGLDGGMEDSAYKCKNCGFVELYVEKKG
jgi:hypothetical protein